MGLTPEDRARIVEEEKVRHETQQKLIAEAKRQEDAKKGVQYIVIILIIVGLVWYNWPDTSKPGSHFAPAPSAAASLSVTDYTWKASEYGGVKLVGTVRNSSSRQFKYAAVEFNLYDKAGNQVGSAIANVNNLEGNGTWKFEAPVFQDGVSTAKLKEVTGF